MYVYMYVCIYVCMYVYREEERSRPCLLACLLTVSDTAAVVRIGPGRVGSGVLIVYIHSC